jgi:hypothetical protein
MAPTPYERQNLLMFSVFIQKAMLKPKKSQYSSVRGLRSYRY